MLPGDTTHDLSDPDAAVRRARPSTARTPSAAELAVGDQAVSYVCERFGAVPLYARVDLLPAPDGPVVDRARAHRAVAVPRPRRTARPTGSPRALAARHDMTDARRRAPPSAERLRALRRMKVIAGRAAGAGRRGVRGVPARRATGTAPGATSQAAAEASMVGGLADWFAVTALFRHPLGMPIPHTAIIPRKKDQIGDGLAGFVQDHFLTGEIVSERVAAAQVPQRVGEWLADPEHAAPRGRRAEQRRSAGSRRRAARRRAARRGRRVRRQAAARARRRAAARAAARRGVRLGPAPAGADDRAARA